MLDTGTKKELRVMTDGGVGAGPYIRLSVEVLEQVCAILDASGLRYWVDHLRISVDGAPAITTINLHGKVDPQQVQTLLDQTAEKESR